MSKAAAGTNTVYRTIWRSIALTVTAVFLLAGAVISAYVIRTTTAQIETQEKTYLADTDAMLEHQISSTQQILNMLMGNPFVIQSVYTGNKDWNSETYWAGQIIVNAVSSSQNYNSIYVISGDRIAIKSSRRYQKKEDEEQMILNMQNHYREMLIPWQSQTGTRISNNLMLLSGIDTMSVPNLTGGVIINMDLNRMAETAFSNHGNRQICMEVDGRVIASSDSNLFFTDKEDHPILNRMKEDSDALIDGNYVFALKNAKYQYTLYSIQNRGDMMQPVLSGLAVIFAAVGALLAVALLISRRLALHAYVPIKTILVEIEENLPADTDENKEKLSEVQRATRSIRRTNEIVSAYRADAETVRLRKYILNGNPDPAVDQLLETRLDCRDEGSIYLTLFKSEIIQDAHVATDILQGLLSSEAKILTMDMPGHQILNFIHFPNDWSETDQIVDQALRQTIQLMNHQGEGKTILVTETVPDHADALPEAYRRASERMRASVFCKNSTMLQEPDLSELPAEISQAVYRNAQEPDETAYLQAVESCIEACRHLEPMEAYHHLATLCMRISETGSNRNMSIPERMNSYKAIQHTLFNLQTYDALINYMKTLHQTAIAGINARKSGENNPLAEMTVQYIEAHFQDPSLSAAQVADELGVSVSHLSRMVNKSLGVAFPELLQKIRLEFAEKQLSEHPGISISELAQQCGFSSASYFSASFKKKYGVVPSGYYRMKHPNEKEKEHDC